MNSTASRSKITVSADGRGLVSHSGSLLLTQILRITGLDKDLSQRLERWRPSRAVHDPAKIITDLALTLALVGDCMADIALLRSQPELFGLVASDPTVSRLIDRLAADEARALQAIRAARATARERAWHLAARRAPGTDGHISVKLIPRQENRDWGTTASLAGLGRFYFNDRRRGSVLPPPV